MKAATPGYADWGTFHPNADGICTECGRTIGWHAGYGCYSPTSTGMPAPVRVDVQLELEVAA